MNDYRKLNMVVETPKKNMGEKVHLLGAAFSNKYHARVKYVLMICEDCGKTWGCTPDENGLIYERQLICRDCAGDAVFEQMKKSE